jgi:hypothetical protein
MIGPKESHHPKKRMFLFWHGYYTCSSGSNAASPKFWFKHTNDARQKTKAEISRFSHTNSSKKTGYEVKCSGRVSSSCLARDQRKMDIKTNSGRQNTKDWVTQSSLKQAGEELGCTGTVTVPVPLVTHVVLLLKDMDIIWYGAYNFWLQNVFD